MIKITQECMYELLGTTLYYLALIYRIIISDQRQ